MRKNQINNDVEELDKIIAKVKEMTKRYKKYVEQDYAGQSAVRRLQQARGILTKFRNDIYRSESFITDRIK